MILHADLSEGNEGVAAAGDLRELAVPFLDLFILDGDACGVIRANFLRLHVFQNGLGRSEKRAEVDFQKTLPFLQTILADFPQKIQIVHV